jgi:hypothetical protein
MLATYSSTKRLKDSVLPIAIERGKARGEKRQCIQLLPGNYLIEKIEAIASAHPPRAATEKESLAPGIREKNR